MTNRVSKVQRKTNETDIEVYLNIDGTGKSNINTGIGFCDHMLSAFAKHGRFDLNVDCTGDLEVDAHHSIEDIGISIGKAINESLGDRSGINRMGDATVPLDEAMVQSIVDISGRPFASIDLTFNSPIIGEMPSELISHMLDSIAINALITLHIVQKSGKNDHHIAESAFKSFARALDAASTFDLRINGNVPSTKGTLDA
ncbi:MAG: imidazoleglycerol-phosphate dehydratase HisB [Dehalococcoidia bacterium]|jgi:imidazoleglycerol-phosphate dehydratase|nr:MAG: imidazoleglycerol-phosphate dehydratase [Chloroflexota bacterium]|tara:strand:+ start:968 stop:1567 length:600 start_codon:yes stop_codon:yes gene_type:complete